MTSRFSTHRASARLRRRSRIGDRRPARSARSSRARSRLAGSRSRTHCSSACWRTRARSPDATLGAPTPSASAWRMHARMRRPVLERSATASSSRVSLLSSSHCSRAWLNGVAAAPLMFTSTPSRCCRRRPLKFIARVNRLSPRAPDIRAARIRARTEFAAEQLAIACIDFVLSPQINLRSKKFAHCTARLAWFVKFFPPAPDELMVSLWYLQRATCLFRFATLHAIFR